MAMVKKTHTATIKSMRPSTSGAKLDADSGYNGNCDCTVLVCSLVAQIRARRCVIAAAENQKGEEHSGNCEHAAQADDAEDRGTIAGRARIILKAIQQDVIHGRPDFSGGRIHQSQANIAGRKFHSIKIARDVAIGRQQEQSARVRKEIVLRVKIEMEISRIRGSGDGFFATANEMPSGGGVGT